MDELGRRELAVLRTLDNQQRGHGGESAAMTLTAAEYSAAVFTLMSRGLCGADVRTVRDDYREAPAYLVDRVWLTVEGRGFIRSVAAA